MASGVETFTGSDGSALPAPWVTKADYAGTGGSVTIQGNRARLRSPTSAYAGQTATFGTATAIDVTVTLQIHNPEAEQYPGVVWHVADSGDSGTEPFNQYGDPDNGFIAWVDTVGNTVGYSRLTGGTAGAETHAAFTVGDGETVKLRVRSIGGHHQVKAWLVVDPEPTAWLHDWSDTTWTSGLYGFRNQAQLQSIDAFFDDFAWDDAPAYGPGELVQDLGSAVSNTSGTTLTISFTGSTKPAVGDLVCVYCARDNVTNDPGTGDSFSDGEGNTYTAVVLAQPAGTSTAAAGIVGVLFYTVVTSAWTGTNTLTWTLPSRVGKVMQAHHFKGPVVGTRGTVDTAGAAAGTVAVLTTDPVAGDLVVAMSAYEHSTASTVTADSDTTNGSWSTQTAQVASGGTTLAAVKVVAQYKAVTATGNQSYATSNSTTASVDTVGIVATFVPSYPRRAQQPTASRGGTINSNFY